MKKEAGTAENKMRQPFLSERRNFNVFLLKMHLKNVIRARYCGKRP